MLADDVCSEEFEDFRVRGAPDQVLGLLDFGVGLGLVGELDELGSRLGVAVQSVGDDLLDQRRLPRNVSTSTTFGHRNALTELVDEYGLQCLRASSLASFTR